MSAAPLSKGVNTCFNKLNHARLLKIRKEHAAVTEITNNLTDGYAKVLQDLVNLRVDDPVRPFVVKGKMNYKNTLADGTALKVDDWKDEDGDVVKVFEANPAVTFGGLTTYRLERDGTPAEAAKYDDCTELQYMAAADGGYKLLTDTSSVAVSAWYANAKNWDYGKNRPKDVSTIVPKVTA